jgi:hypothetical protein
MPTTQIPGKMVPTSGPYVAGIGAIPDKTKSHMVPGRAEQNGNKARVNSGPSKSDMGAIPAKTKSHVVPPMQEMSGGAQAGGVMPPIMLSGHDRMSPASADVHKKWSNKGKYSMSNQDA